MLPIVRNSTDQYIVIGPVRSTTDPYNLKTDITSSTSGLSIKAQVNNGSIVTLSPAAMSAGGSHADGGIYHVGQGMYRIGLTDALCVTGGTVFAWIELTGFECVFGERAIVDYNPLDAAGLGLSRVDATVSSRATSADLSVTVNPPAVGNVTLAAEQPNYAPAKAGDAMGLDANVISSLVEAGITLKSPTLADRAIRLFEGNDYLAAIGEAITRTLTQADNNFIAVSCLLVIKKGDVVKLSKAGTVLVPTGLIKVSFDINAAETFAIGRDFFEHFISITDASNRTKTPWFGKTQILASGISNAA